MDGKHLSIWCPENGGWLYFSYKSFHSVVLLASIDADYKFCTWILELVPAVMEECLKRRIWKSPLKMASVSTRRRRPISVALRRKLAGSSQHCFHSRIQPASVWRSRNNPAWCRIIHAGPSGFTSGNVWKGSYPREHAKWLGYQYDDDHLSLNYNDLCILLQWSTTISNVIRQPLMSRWLRVFIVLCYATVTTDKAILCIQSSLLSTCPSFSTTLKFRAHGVVEWPDKTVTSSHTDRLVPATYMKQGVYGCNFGAIQIVLLQLHYVWNVSIQHAQITVCPKFSHLCGSAFSSPSFSKCVT